MHAAVKRVVFYMLLAVVSMGRRSTYFGGSSTVRS